jgi:hypothetical protein
MHASAAATKPATTKPAAARKLASPKRLVADKPATAKAASAGKLTKQSANTPSPPQRRAGVPGGGSGERHQNEGHGRRLTMAFEALEAFPALAESRDRLLAVISKDHVATADVVAT